MFYLRKRSARLFWCSSVLVMSIASAAGAKPGSLEANREWVRTATQDQMNQGHPEKAIQILQDHLKTDKEDEISWANLALLQKNLNRCDEAQASLLRASNLGTSGQKEIYMVAADQLRTKGCKPLAKEELIIAADQSTQEDGAWSGSAKVLVGYDDNVLLVADSQTASVSPQSAFVTPTANVSYSKNISSGLLSAQSVTSYTSYTSSDVQDYNSLSESLSLDFEPNKDSLPGWDHGKNSIGCILLFQRYCC